MSSSSNTFPDSGSHQKSDGDDRAAAVAEEALVDREADFGAFNLAAFGLAAELPGQFADLGDRLGRDRFTKASKAAGGVDRHFAADFGDAITD